MYIHMCLQHCVSAFDCFDATNSDSTLLLKFFAPLILLHQEYWVTVAMVHRTNMRNNIRTVFSTALKKFRMPWIKYDFDWYCHPNSTQAKLMLFWGQSLHMLAMVGNLKFETEISFSENLFLLLNCVQSFILCSHAVHTAIL